MDSKRVLIVTTSHDRLGDTGHPTGLWLEELATPWYALKDGGADVVLASIKGGAVPMDPRSIPQDAGTGPGEEPQAAQEEVPPAVRRFLDDPAAMDALRNTPSVEDAAKDRCDALFLPGGHGTMWDLPGSGTLAEMVGAYMDDGRIVAAVCHGPAGLVGAKRRDGSPVVQDREVSAFTTSEEDGVGLRDAVPFLLEQRLPELGAKYRKGPDWQPFAVRDGNLITGQNPQSSALVAQHLLEALDLPAGAGAAAGEPTDQDIRERAYALWEQDGRPEGRHEDHWHRARSDLSGRARSDANLSDAAGELRRTDGMAAEDKTEPAQLETRTGRKRERSLGGAGRSGTIRTPRP